MQASRTLPQLEKAFVASKTKQLQSTLQVNTHAHTLACTSKCHPSLDSQQLQHIRTSVHA